MFVLLVVNGVGHHQMSYFKYDNDYLNKIFASVCFRFVVKSLVYLENLGFKDALWWHHNAIVVRKVDTLYEVS